jgi:hypothetical protein
MEEDSLHHRFIEKADVSCGYSCFDEGARYQGPFGLSLLQILVEGRPVADVAREDSSEVAEEALDLRKAGAFDFDGELLVPPSLFLEASPLFEYST